VTLPGSIFSREIILLLGGEGPVIDLGTGYLRIIFFGYLFQFFSFCLNYAFRGVGDMRTPMKIMFIASMTNIGLDPLLIFGLGPIPALGVQGAAVATVIAQFLSVLFGLHVLRSGRSYVKIALRERLPLDPGTIKSILRIGLPTGLQYGLLSLSGMSILRLASEYGAAAVGAAGIGFRVRGVANLPVVGLAAATQTLVGQNLGAGKPERAHRSGLQAMFASIGIMGVFGLLFYLFAPWIYRFFSADADVIRCGVGYLHVVAISQPFVGIILTLNGTFRGAGYTRLPMAFAATKLVLLVLLALLLSTVVGLGLRGIWWGMVLAFGTEAVLDITCFYVGRWEETVLR
jgi:putative MATE family efflux protein